MYLPGDDVQFCTAESARALLTGEFGRDAIHEEALVGRGPTTSPISSAYETNPPQRFSSMAKSPSRDSFRGALTRCRPSRHLAFCAVLK